MHVKRIYLMMLLLCCLTAGAQAQNDSTRIAIEKINSIKLDAANYLYAEVTMADWLEAYNAAKALLKEQLASWLVNQQQQDVTSYVARSDEKIFEIKAQRGNRYRAFVYLKKSDVLALKDDRQLVTVSSEEVQDKAAEETLFKIPESAKPAAPAMPKIEQDMLAVTSFGDIETFIGRQQSENAITSFGKYANRPSSGTYYMFVYNREAQIPAYLRVEDGKITNLKTGNEDSMDAYKNCGAIWFR